MKFVLDQNESVLWKGSLLFPRFAKITLVGLVVLFGVFQVFAFLGFPQQNQIVLDVNVASLIVIFLVVISINMNTRFYVTNRRIVRAIDWYVLKRTSQLPLESIAEVKISRVYGKGFVRFVPRQGNRRVVFGPIQDDAEKVRDTAIRARSEMAI